jgi:hypothetical protein
VSTKIVGSLAEGKNYLQDTRCKWTLQEKSIHRWDMGFGRNWLQKDSKNQHCKHRRSFCLHRSIFLCHKVEFDQEKGTHIQLGKWSKMRWLHSNMNQRYMQNNWRHLVVKNSQLGKVAVRMQWKDKNGPRDKRYTLVPHCYMSQRDI